MKILQKYNIFIKLDDLNFISILRILFKFIKVIRNSLKNVLKKINFI